MGEAGPGTLDERLVRFRSGRGEDARALAADLLAQERAAHAKEVLETALRGQPEEPDLLILMGRARLATDDLLGAQGALLKAARLAPKDAAPFRWLCEVLLRRGDRQRAGRVLVRAQSLAPGDPEVRELAARLSGASEADVDDAEERTVIRTDLTDQLRRMVQQQDQAEQAPPGAAAPPRRLEPTAEQPLQHEEQATSGDPGAGLATGFDEAPTAVVPAPGEAAPRPRGLAWDGDAEDGTTKKRRAPTEAFEPSAPLSPPPKKRRPTVAFESAPTGVEARPIPPPAPRRPPPPSGTTSSGATSAPRPPKRKPRRTMVFGDEPAAPADRPSRSGVGVPGRADAGGGTSPGAAAAPEPPAPRRVLPSQRPVAAGPAPAGAPPEAPGAREEMNTALGFLAEGVGEEGAKTTPGGLAAADPLEDVTPPPARLEVLTAGERPSGAHEETEWLAPPPSEPPPPARPPRVEPPPLGPSEDAPPPAADAAEAPHAPPAVPPDPPMAEAAQPAAEVREPGSPSTAQILARGSATGSGRTGSGRTGSGRTGSGRTGSGRTGSRSSRISQPTAPPRGRRWPWVVLLLGVALAAGGFFGWRWWQTQLQDRASRLVARATEEAYSGDPQAQRDALDRLRQALELEPTSSSAAALRLFIRSQQALEDGAFDAESFRRPIADAERRVGAGGAGPELEAYLDVARAVIASGQGRHAQALELSDRALSARARDPAILYAVGRLEQRLGSEAAGGHLLAAVQGEPSLISARIALAALRHDRGREASARELLEGSDEPRLRLWRAFWAAADRDAARRASAELDELRGWASEGTPADRIVHALATARAARSQGRRAEAVEALDAARAVETSEPRLLSRIATEAHRLGRLADAVAALEAAVDGAPDNRAHRRELAELRLASGDAEGALAALESLSPGPGGEDPLVAAMRARIALASGDRQILRRAARQLDARLEADPEADVELRALRVRLHDRLGEPMLAEARALWESAPANPHASRALGEAALGALEAQTAAEALGRLVEATPEDPQAHLLRGRALRMSGDAEGAAASFERAVELDPDWIEARWERVELQLDTGRYEEAEQTLAALAEAAGEDATGEDATGEDGAGEDGAGEDATGEDGAGEDGTGEDATGDVGTGEVGAGQDGAREDARGAAAVSVAQVQLARARAAAGAGDVERAGVLLEELPEGARRAPRARLAQARVALAAGEPDRALQLLEALPEPGEATANGAAEGAAPRAGRPGRSEVQPADVRALRGDALLAAGRTAPAAEAYDEALRLDAGHPEALLGKARMAVRSSRAADAHPLLERLGRVLEQRIRPPSFHAERQVLLGRAHMLAGPPAIEQARAALRRAIELDPTSPDPHFHLAETLAGHSSREARAAYERYLELAPEGAYAERARRALR